MSGEIKIDYRMPLYIQIEDMILKKIEEGQFLPGAKIPSEREMAQVYMVNRMTVKRAVNSLVEKGYLYRQQGSGTFVARRENNKVDIGYEGGVNFGTTALIRAVGGEVSNSLIGRDLIEYNSYLESKLEIEAGEKIYALGRVRHRDGVPMSIEYTYIPLKYFPGIEEVDFVKVSLYDYMDVKEKAPILFREKILIINAGKREAKLLDIPEGKAIYYCEYIGKDKNDNIVEYSEEYFNSDIAEIRFHIK